METLPWKLNSDGLIIPVTQWSRFHLLPLRPSAFKKKQEAKQSIQLKTSDWDPNKYLSNPIPLGAALAANWFGVKKEQKLLPFIFIY
jgi:hypothetical protein